MIKLSNVEAEIALIKARFAEELQVFAKAKAVILEDIADMKLVITEAAKEEFKATGKKQLLGGVKIQEKKAKEFVYDAAAALKWAKEKDMFLLLDKKGFEKVVESLDVDFVDVKNSVNTAVTFPAEIKLED